jgi:hypothetical protein
MTTTPAIPAAPMRRRSWYLAAGDADRLDAIVADLHHATRQPKHVVLAALLATADEHRAEILARLTANGSAA